MKTKGLLDLIIEGPGNVASLVHFLTMFMICVWAGHDLEERKSRTRLDASNSRFGGLTPVSIIQYQCRRCGIFTEIKKPVKPAEY